jgi:hypothetical protein
MASRQRCIFERRFGRTVTETSDGITRKEGVRQGLSVSSPHGSIELTVNCNPQIYLLPTLPLRTYMEKTTPIEEGPVEIGGKPLAVGGTTTG